MRGLYRRGRARARGRNRVRPRGLSSSSIFSFRSFDFKSNRFIKRSVIGCFITIIVCASLV